MFLIVFPTAVIFTVRSFLNSLAISHAYFKLTFVLTLDSDFLVLIFFFWLFEFKLFALSIFEIVFEFANIYFTASAQPSFAVHLSVLKLPFVSETILLI